VDIHALPLRQRIDGDLMVRLCQHVGEERRRRVERFRRWQDAQQSLFGELLARAVAMDRLGLADRDVAFVRDAAGKPSVAGTGTLHINVSHSGDWVVCAAAEAPVGVDVERVEERTSVEDMLIAFSPDERRAFAEIPHRDRRSWVHIVWTVKEAYLKAHGTGLSVAPDTLTVSLGGAGGSIAIARNGTRVPGITFHHRALDPEHPMTSCVLEPDVPCIVHIWSVDGVTTRFVA